MKEKIAPKLPIISVSLLGTVSVYFTLRAIFNYLFLMTGQFTGGVSSFILFGDSTKPSFILFLFSTAWLITGWLVTTKYERFKGALWRSLWFWNMFIGITFHYIWLVTAPVYNTLLPNLGERISTMEVDNVWHAVAVGDTNILFLTIVFIPTIMTFMMLLWLSGQYSLYSNDIKKAFKEFEFSNVHLQKWFKLDKKEQWPDVVLGPDSETRELVVQPGRDRTLNNVIVGSIGTGKTAALILQLLNQDLHWMSRFINAYPSIFKRKDYHTESVKGMYLNGVSVIEPSNDLCQKAFKLVKAHGIPEESVFYIDPTNPDTPCINPMQGPVEKVAEAFTMVMEGLAEGGTSNFFFQQSERNHLKSYIYLLKLHKPGQEVTFDMLLKMYDNPQLVRLMQLQLKETFPDNIELIENRDERNHWAIVKQIDEWFDNNLIPLTERVGGSMVPVVVKHGEYRGQPAFTDAKAEYVQGLRNILNDIGASPLIRRVLFGKSDFDFDRHLESGGVLLVNTAKGELGGLSNVLGKLVLLSLQNAVFRREPNVSTFHHIVVDEFPDYIYQPFKEFPAQSRKYKTIVTVVAQTVAQLADKYGETYMHILLGTLRHKMVYGDIPDFDAQLFSRIFGEKEKFEEGIQEQAVSPLQEKPVLRMGNSYQRKKEAILSPSDIIFQKPFQCAVKIVSKNRPLPVRQIDANFVPDEEFIQAKIQVEPEAAKIWSDNRNGIVIDSIPDLVEKFILEEEEVIEKQEDLQSEEKMPLTIYPGPEKPISYSFDAPKKELEQINKWNPSNEKVPADKATQRPMEQPHESSVESLSGEEEAPVIIQLSSLVNESFDPNENKPEKSHLGPEHEQFTLELQKELDEVANPTNDKTPAFFSDYED
ncbi:type IV secretory system conjugative DNA transfer family protein [Mesobacillus zeae]|uniref:type IV secretory system conjugative DNA transfer family protein n=1 Tax=Mesobacillus zeae TaxID=1917180 RepID=UPI0030099E9E